jgi:hypothetical protein
MIRCDLVLSVEGEGEDMVVNTCPDEAVFFVRSVGGVYAWCRKHAPAIGKETLITREEYLVHKIMEC